MAHFLLRAALFGADRGVYCRSIIPSLRSLDIHTAAWPFTFLPAFSHLHVLSYAFALYAETCPVYCYTALLRLSRDHFTTAQSGRRIPGNALLCGLYQFRFLLAGSHFSYCQGRVAHNSTPHLYLWGTGPGNRSCALG